MIHYAIHAIPTPGQSDPLAQTVPSYQKLLLAHGAKSVQSFVVGAGPDVGSLMHIVGYEDSAAAEKVRDAVRNDAEWKSLQDTVNSKIANLTIGTLYEVS
jgi:hypothetical protein